MASSKRAFAGWAFAGRAKAGASFRGVVAASPGTDYPDPGDVRNGTVYANGTMTGTCVLPDEVDVRLATSYGRDGTEFTGTLNPSGGSAPTVEEIVTGIAASAFIQALLSAVYYSAPISGGRAQLQNGATTKTDANGRDTIEP